MFYSFDDHFIAHHFTDFLLLYIFNTLAVV